MPDDCKLVERLATVEAQLAAAREALVVARNDLNTWKASRNEWQSTVTDLLNRFAMKSEITALEDKINLRMKHLEDHSLEATGKQSAFGNVWAVAAVVIGLGIAAISATVAIITLTR